MTDFVALLAEVSRAIAKARPLAVHFLKALIL
jgi:hypothetical protein